MPENEVNVRYMVDDVDAAIAFYTAHLGFTVRSSAAPAFADVIRGRSCSRIPRAMSSNSSSPPGPKEDLLSCHRTPQDRQGRP